VVNIHYSRTSDIVVPDRLTTEPFFPITPYRDAFGNWCQRGLQGKAPKFPLEQRRPAEEKAIACPRIPSAASQMENTVNPN
jgi:hypothetical protein